MLGVREDGILSREGHDLQIRTTHRHLLVPRRLARTYADAIHAPKRETFDVAARTNTDPKGVVRAVDLYTERPWGLYLARPTPGREQFHYLESWLLPELGLRATIFHFNAGHERDQDYYLDVGRFTRNGDLWTSEDHYLDLVVRTGRDVSLIDVDELMTAVQVGLLSPETADQAVHTATTAIDGLARNGYDLDRWMASRGMVLTWPGA
jgi:predicted RNA-binding protein associated with RNAse of E/G family